MTTKTVEIGPCTLHLGDCLEVLPSIPEASVQAVITDPLYGIDYQSAWRTDRSQWKPKIANDTRPFIWFLHPCRRVCANPGAILCFCRWDVQEAFRQAIEWAGFDVRAQVIWDREAHGMGDLGGTPAPQHDVIWFAKVGDYKFHGDRPKSIVRSSRLTGEQLTHPNEKPVDLIAGLVEDYCPAGGKVLDPCMGSGSAGEACIIADREFVGIETDPSHFEAACERLERAWKKRRGQIRFDTPERSQPALFAG